MTKVSVFGEEPKKYRELKKIQFTHLYERGRKKIVITTDTDDWENVMKISSDGKYDIMLVWDNDDTGKFVYFGHWNDGVV